MSRRNDKRVRLIESADKLFHQQGISTTTLANIASLAEVPLGNVYYYFKSKESIVLAVIDYRRKAISEQLEEFNLLADAKARLQALINATRQNSEIFASHGDALGSLCQELGKSGGQLAETSANLMAEFIDWCANQFQHMGKGDKADALARKLVANLQGISLLTLVFSDTALTNQQADLLLEWLDNI